MADAAGSRGHLGGVLAGVAVLGATGATVLVPIASIEARLAWVGPLVAAPLPFAIIGFWIGNGLLDRSLDWPDPQPRALGTAVALGWIAAWLAGWIVLRGPSPIPLVFLGVTACCAVIAGGTLVAMRRDPLAA